MSSSYASVTAELRGPSREEMQRQLERVVHSDAFRHASALQRLLQYLGTRVIEKPATEIKEYTVGVEVFGRGADYDPKINTIVRVQIHRLRLKLADYYQSEGTDDHIVIEIPRGKYLPTFAGRGAPRSESARRHSLAQLSLGAGAGVGSSPEPKVEAEQAQPQNLKQRFLPHRVGRVLFATALFASGLILGVLWNRLGRTQSRIDNASLPATAAEIPSGDPAQDFWRSFLGNDSAPVLGYADAVFLVDDTNDLLRFRRGASDDRGTRVDPHLARQFASNPGLVARAGPLYYEDGYTGTGDAEGIFILTRFFTRMGLQLQVKRCRLMTIDDLKQHNVILLGSSDQNKAVEQLSKPKDFVFERSGPYHAWSAQFVNHHPLPGEAHSYGTERDPVTQELKANYALLNVQPGVVPGRYVAILSALDTSGVAGAVQFMTSKPDMADLLHRLETLGAKISAGQPPAFQALVKVELEKGHDVLSTRLLTVHLIRPEVQRSTGNPAPDNTLVKSH